MFVVPAADHARALTTSDLREAGLTKRQIAGAVEGGHLVRLRLGRYALAGTPVQMIDAARWGGRLDCISLLSLLGVFVHTHTVQHIQIDPHATRLPPRPLTVRCHWRPTSAQTTSLVVDVLEALAQAVICQSPRHAIATLDSALHLGVIDEPGLDEMFSRLPPTFQVLRDLVDPQSESGPETLVRLILRTLGHRPELQVRIDGVWRVDLLVDGWLIVECDSRRFHSDWRSQVHDRRRDAAALARGYVTLRLVAADILSQPDVIRAQLEHVLGHGPAVPRSGAKRALRRDDPRRSRISRR